MQVTTRRRGLCDYECYNLFFNGIHELLRRFLPTGKGRQGFRELCKNCQLLLPTATKFRALPAARAIRSYACKALATLAGIRCYPLGLFYI